VASDPASAVAIGLVTPVGAWAGFVRDSGGDGFRLAFSGTDGGATPSAAEGSARRAELMALAVAYYEEALDAPPPELEATQADLAELVRWLAAQEPDPPRHALFQEAIDAIDDGLAGDVVVARLNRVARVTCGESAGQADPIDLLVSRYEALVAPKR